MDHSFLLSLIVFLPALAALLVWALPSRETGMVKGAALGGSLVVFVVSLGLVLGFDPTTHHMQFVESYQWLPHLGVGYQVGIDGISLWLVMLTTLLTPIVVLAAFSGVEKNLREYMVCLLFLETGMLGALVATDLFLFYVFWEAMLVPMYLLIGFWGGSRRIYAAVKFFLFTMVGSLLMLVAILYLYFEYHELALRLRASGLAEYAAIPLYTADIRELARLAFSVLPGTTVPMLTQFEQVWLFAAFALAFAIKVPVFPFHTWLPDAHTEAPTGGSVILAGVLLKMGTYGFLRFAIPLFPLGMEALLPLIAVLSVIGIVYGAMVSLVQDDVKRLVAYSSVSHLGFVMLGIAGMTERGLAGAVLQMINHGISTGALFLCIGVMYERLHTREISKLGGISAVAPAFAALFMITTFSSIGVPGLNGFIGEFLVLVGTFQAAPFDWFPLLGGPVAAIFNSVLQPIPLTILAALGVILSAGYMLWMFQRVMFGPVKNDHVAHMTDLTWRERIYLAPLIVLMFVLGLFPNLLLGPMDASISHLVRKYEQAVQTHDGPGEDDKRKGAVESDTPGRLAKAPAPQESLGSEAITPSQDCVQGSHPMAATTAEVLAEFPREPGAPTAALPDFR